MRLFAFAAAGIAALALSGCSLFMHSIEKPKADVRDVSLSSASFSGVSGELHLDVMNPNSFSVPLSGIDWTLSVGGARAVTGSVQLSQQIPAKGVAPVTTSLSIATGDALNVAAVLARGSRDYQISVRLHFSTQVGQIDVDVTHQGQLGEGTQTASSSGSTWTQLRL
ncbi:MAG TPA: LEA type 2 family protein [Kofleriaceae bacterium]|jgi:LEA14-like dessication related protein|nr:LEA type 2 family protein [Kofleriaceae bacterium]